MRFELDTQCERAARQVPAKWIPGRCICVWILRWMRIDRIPNDVRAFDNLRALRIHNNDFERFTQECHIHVEAIPLDKMPEDRILESIFNEQVKTHMDFPECYKEYDLMMKNDKNNNYKFLKTLARRYVTRLREDNIMQQSDRSFALPLVDEYYSDSALAAIHKQSTPRNVCSQWYRAGKCAKSSRCPFQHPSGLQGRGRSNRSPSPRSHRCAGSRDSESFKSHAVFPSTEATRVPQWITKVQVSLWQTYKIQFVKTLARTIQLTPQPVR